MRRVCITTVLRQEVGAQSIGKDGYILRLLRALRVLQVLTHCLLPLLLQVLHKGLSSGWAPVPHAVQAHTPIQKVYLRVLAVLLGPTQLLMAFLCAAAVLQANMHLLKAPTAPLRVSIVGQVPTRTWKACHLAHCVLLGPTQLSRVQIAHRCASAALQAIMHLLKAPTAPMRVSIVRLVHTPS